MCMRGEDKRNGKGSGEGKKKTMRCNGMVAGRQGRSVRVNKWHGDGGRKELQMLKVNM